MDGGVMWLIQERRYPYHAEVDHFPRNSTFFLTIKEHTLLLMYL